MILRAGIDSELQLDDGHTYTSTNAGTVDSSAGIIDLGTDYANYPVVLAHFDISAIDTASGNETYDIQVEMASATGFSTVTSEVIERITAAGQHTYAFVPKDQYVRANFTLGGTTPSITVDYAYLTGDST